MSELVKRNALEALELRNMKQTDLARALGWSRDKANRVLRGEREIRVDELVSLAMALSVAPVVLMLPWEDETEVVTPIVNGEWMELSGEETFAWFVGISPPRGARFRGAYFRLLPKWMRGQDKPVADALTALRTALRIRVDEKAQTVEWLDEDGETVLGYRWGDEA